MTSLLFRRVIWAAVLPQRDLGTSHEPNSLDPVLRFLPTLLGMGNPRVSHFTSLGFLPTCCPPVVDQEAEEALKFPSREILQARKEPSLAALPVRLAWIGCSRWEVGVRENHRQLLFLRNQRAPLGNILCHRPGIL